MKYHILTLGCQMNKSDSERIARVLENLDFKKIDTEESADLIVVNSCSVRQSAIDRIFGKAHKWNKEKIRRGKEGITTPLITMLTGCVLTQDKKKLGKLFDIILNIKDLPRLPEMLHKSYKFPAITKDYFQIKPIYQNPWSAFVPIMTGCDNFCAYCAVPYTRGREVSRSVKEILTEIKNLVDNGCLEITLLGQNVNTFQKSKVESRKSKVDCDFSKKNPYKDSFAALLWEINQITPQSRSTAGLNRIHFTAPHPKDMSGEVVDALILPKHVNFLHLPLQSGDDEILKRMNRNYTAADYLKLIKKIRNKKPNIALGTDIIVGFPGETKKQFENTVRLYKEVEFDISYTAKYSPRAGTAAAKLEDNVSWQEKKRHWEILQKLMEKIVYKKNQRYVGQEVEVLVDKVVQDAGWFSVARQGTGNQNALKNNKSASRFGVSDDNSEPATDTILYEGNSREYKRVRFFSKDDLSGKVVKVKVKKAMTWMLEGKVG